MRQHFRKWARLVALVFLPVSLATSAPSVSATDRDGTETGTPGSDIDTAVADGGLDHPHRFGSPSYTATAPAPHMYSSNARYGGLSIEVAFGGPAPHEYGSFSITAYTTGRDDLRVAERFPAQTDPPRSVSMSARVAWHVVQVLTGDKPAGQYVGSGDELPEWMLVVNRGSTHGSSGGMITALAALDASQPGLLAGDLLVSGSAVITSDGSLVPITGADAKYLVANLAGADVFFTSAPVKLPEGAGVTPETFRTTRGFSPTATTTVPKYLLFDEFEELGAVHRDMALDATPIVEVSDIRQVLAYLCGRTGGAVACTLVERIAATTLAELRPYSALAKTLPPTAPARIEGPDAAV
jgi:hypothetical protein